MFNKNHYRINFIILSLIFVILKIYFLLIAKVNFGSFAYPVNAFIYYNTRSFAEIPQSFHDWNHPGTPIYYLTFVLSKFLLENLNIDNFQKFVNIHHVFIIIFTLISLNFSILKLRKYLNSKEIFFSILFIYSFYSFIHTLEIADATNYLFPMSLLIVTQTIDLLNNQNRLRKKLFIFAIISSLGISIKMALLPLVLMSYLIITFDNFKKIKEILILNLTLFVSFVLFNLPIIGRIPRVIYTVLFVRTDTRFSLDDVFLQKIIKLFQLIAFQNLFLIVLIFLFLIIFFINLKKIQKFSYNKNFIYSILIFICFMYTLLVANDEINTFDKYNKTGFFLRNCYFNSIFIIPLFIGLCNIKKKFIYSLKIFIYIFILSSFITNIFFYDNFRDQKNIRVLQNKEKFNIIINDLLPKNSLIGIYEDSGYGFENEMIHYVGNSLFAGEKFNKDLIESFKNIRFFRLHDFILNNFSSNELTLSDNVQKSINLTEKKNKNWIKDIISSFDVYLKDNLPKNIYLILSHNSHKLTSTFPGKINRPKNIFIKNENEKIDFIIFNENNLLMRQFGVSGISLIKKLENYLKIKDINEFDIDKDKWFIIKLQ
jgi:hypothetical protein